VALRTRLEAGWPWNKVKAMERHTIGVFWSRRILLRWCPRATSLHGSPLHRCRGPEVEAPLLADRLECRQGRVCCGLMTTRFRNIEFHTMLSRRRLIGDSKSVRALILGTASDAPQLQQEAVPALPPFLPAATIHGSHSTASGDDQQTHRSVAPGIAPSSGHSPVQTEVIEITDCEAETAAFHESERAKASIRESAPQLGTGNVQAPRRPSETASTARRNVETEKFQSLRVAVVDDEPANQRIACRFLKALGVPPANITVMRDGMCEFGSLFWDVLALTCSRAVAGC
jgi:hypothetical protein